MEWDGEVLTPARQALLTEPLLGANHGLQGNSTDSFQRTRRGQCTEKVELSVGLQGRPSVPNTSLNIIQNSAAEG